MANIIDALVVELGFDTRGIQQGRKDVADIFKRLRDDSTDTGKKIEESAKHVTESISGLRNGLLDLLVVFTAGKGIKEWITDITSADVSLGKLSRSTEQAVGTISQLEGAAAASGGTAQGMASTIANLQSAAQQFAITGQSAVLPYLRALGVQFKIGKDGAVDVNQELTDLSAAAQRLGGGARAAEMLRGAGVTDEGTLNLLLQGPAALARFRAEIAAAGTPKQSDIEAANRRNEAWQVFDRSLTTLGRNVLTTLTPALLSLGKALTHIMETVANSPGLMRAATVAFTALAGAVAALSVASVVAFARLTLLRSGVFAIFPILGRLIGLIGGAVVAAVTDMALALAVLTETAFPALSAAFLSFGAVLEATPIGWIITLVAALGFGAYELIEHWSAVSGFFKGLWADIAGTFEKGAAAISKIPIVRWAFRKLGIAPSGEGPSQSAPGAGKPSGQATASDRAINAVLRHEDATLSGKVTSDSGGVTKFGISSNAHPGLDVANLSLADAKTIYKSQYWDPIGGDALPAALQATALDAAINQGVANARKWLKESGGDVSKFNALRRGQYQHLAEANPEKYGKYLKGWLSRVPSSTQASLATASAGIAAPASPWAGAGSAALASNSYHGTTNSNNQSSSEVRVGPINIYPKSGDAKGIASELAPMLKHAVLAAQSQSGQS